MSVEKHKADIISSLSDRCEICPELDICMKNDLRDINMYCENVINRLIDQLATEREKVKQLTIDLNDTHKKLSAWLQD
jgi:hypothetical protein